MRQFKPFAAGGAALLAGAILASHSAGAPKEPATQPAVATTAPASQPAPTDPKLEADWKRLTKQVATNFVACDGHFMALPALAPHDLNSRHVSYSAWADEHIVVPVIDARDNSPHRRYKGKDPAHPRAPLDPPSPYTSGDGFSGRFLVYWFPYLEDAQYAAAALPKFAIGEFGYIHTGKIEKIIGPHEMILSDIRLIDSDLCQTNKAMVEEAHRKLVDAEAKWMEAAMKYYDLECRIDCACISGPEVAAGMAPATGSSRKIQPVFQSPASTVAEFAKFNNACYEEAYKKMYVARDELLKVQIDAHPKTLRVLGAPTEGLKVGNRWGDFDMPDLPLQTTFAAYQSCPEPKAKTWPGLEKRVDTHGRRVDKGGHLAGVYPASFRGVWLCIVAQDSDGTLVAIASDKLKVKPTADEFGDAVLQAGWTKEQFVKLAKAEMLRDGQKSIPRILTALQKPPTPDDAQPPATQPQ